jgi:hypothetical protein
MSPSKKDIEAGLLQLGSVLREIAAHQDEESGTMREGAARRAVARQAAEGSEGPPAKRDRRATDPGGRYRQNWR